MKTMYSLLASLILLSLVTLPQSLIAAPNSDVVGTWESVTTYQGSPYKGTFEVKEESGKLTAMWLTASMGTKISNVAYKGGFLSFSFYHPMGGYTSLKVAINGATGSGEAEGDWGTAPTTVKKAGGASADAILGEWRVTTHIDGDTYAGNVVFSKEGGVLKGYWTQAKQNLKNVTYKGGKLSFSMNHYEGGPTKLILTPKGDAMSGSISGSWGETTATADKVQ